MNRFLSGGFGWLKKNRRAKQAERGLGRGSKGGGSESVVVQSNHITTDSFCQPIPSNRSLFTGYLGNKS